MLPFAFETVRTEAEAIAAGAAGGRFIAGGTTLIDLMREEVERPARLVDIRRLPLGGIAADGSDLVIGALSRMSEVAGHPQTRLLAPLVAESQIEAASPQIRNVATIGGNLLQRVRCPYFRMLDAACNKRSPGSGCAAIGGLHAGHAILGTSPHCIATHPSDLAVALVALDAQVRLRAPQGERTLPVERLFRLPGDTPDREHDLGPGELIVELRVPGGPHQRRARYLKVRARASYEYAVVSIAATLHVEDGAIRDVRLAAGGVGTLPWRLRACERALIGKPIERDAFTTAAGVAAEGAQPLPGNHFKVDLLARTVVRALEMAGEVA